MANAHPNGSRPWSWPDYVEKFATLAGASLDPAERARFPALLQRLPALAPAELIGLTPVLPDGAVTPAAPTGRGIFDHGLAAR